jgi:5-carboxymethyl-2-hydroxymuconate isomerase
MPHIVVEVTRALGLAAPLLPTLHRIHRAFADNGYTPIENMKSRIHLVDEALAGEGSTDISGGSQFAVAWLTTNNVRTREVERAMTDIVQSELERWAEMARIELAVSEWLQICVMFRYVPLENYRKRQWNAPGG